MLRSAYGVVAGRGYRLAQADITIILERPKLAPYLHAMSQALAAVFGLAGQDLSVKAKTNEGMGFIGRGEGIAVMAVALLERG